MTHDEETVERVAKAMWDSRNISPIEDANSPSLVEIYKGLARAALSAMPAPTVQEAAKVLLGSGFSSPIIEALDPYRNDVEIHEDVRTALRDLAEGDE